MLAWAVQGAVRLLARGHFPDLASSREALGEWAQSADPVLGWAEDRITTGLSVVGEEPPRTTYVDFKLWAALEGYSEHGLPNVTNFVQRLRAIGPSKGFSYKRSGSFRGFVGMRLKSLTKSGDTAKADAA